MPQASDELRKLASWIINYNLDCAVPSDKEVCNFLIRRGYQLLPDFYLRKPEPNHFPTEMEKLLLRYLADEWDCNWIEDVA